MPSRARGPDRLLVTLQRLLAIRSTNLDEALDEAADLVSAALGAEKVDAFVYQPASETLVAAGTSRTPMGHRQHAIGMDRLPLANGGRTAEVFQTGVSRLTGRADEDPDELRGITEGLGVRSMMCTPLDVGNDRRGVLSVASTEPDRWAEDDLRFLEAVAGWVGMVATRADLTYQIAAQAEEQGRRAAADELVTILAHDLRNHLTPLRGRLQLLHKWAAGDGHDVGLRYISELSRSVDRLGRMVADLLDSARLDQGLFTLDCRSTDLVSIAREAAAALGTTPDRIQVIASNETVYGVVDAARLRSALENLLANALNHSPASAPVLLRIEQEQREDGPWALLTVTDQGPGIPRESQHALFERFARGNSSTGLGLGLYMARRIAEAHGGTLTLDTAYLAGARFTLAVPAVQD